MKEWEGKIKTNFHKKKVPEDSCECKAIIKPAGIYRQGQNYHMQIYLEECKYKDVEFYGSSFLSDSDDEDDIDSFTVL